MNNNLAQELKDRPVFVTGGTGFIGKRLVSSLISLGAQVSVLVRDKRAAGEVTAMGATAHIAGLEDEKRLTAAMKGSEILFSLAYDVRATSAANLANFDRLLSAARTTGIRRIVHTSSIVVYDDWPNADIDEDAIVTQGHGSPYRRAKIEMEERLAASTFETAVIQPTLVYGPDSAMWTYALADMLATGTVILPDPEGKCNAVYVDDVVQALLRAATAQNIAHERFVISGASPVAWSELLNGYAKIIGRGVIRFMPKRDMADILGPEPQDHGDSDGVSMGARISAVGRAVLGRKRFEALVARVKALRGGAKGEHFPDHHLFGVFSATGTCSIDHARAVLGYEPEFDLSAGLAATRATLVRKYSK